MKIMLVVVLLSVSAGAVVGVLRARGDYAQSLDADCMPYDPAKLTIADEGSRGWLLAGDDGARFEVLDTKADADAALAVAKRFHAICYIGRNNKRPDHERFVMTYWK